MCVCACESVCQRGMDSDRLSEIGLRVNIHSSHCSVISNITIWTTTKRQSKQYRKSIFISQSRAALNDSFLTCYSLVAQHFHEVTQLKLRLWCWKKIHHHHVSLFPLPLLSRCFSNALPLFLCQVHRQWHLWSVPS